MSLRRAGASHHRSSVWPAQLIAAQCFNTDLHSINRDSSQTANHCRLARHGHCGIGPTFTRVWSEILMLKGCAGEYCHGSGMGGLALKNKRGAYDALVNIAAAGPACAAKGGMRVAPGSPDASLLVDKLAMRLRAAATRCPSAQTSHRTVFLRVPPCARLKRKLA